MKNTTLPYQKMIDAANSNDLITINNMVKNGFDKSAVNEFGDPILSEIVFTLLSDSAPHRYDIVQYFLSLGFNPNYHDKDNNPPLMEAMLFMDTKMLKTLLDGGAQPNEASGFFEGSTLYDWAEIDYEFTIWDVNNFPEKPTESDLATTKSWLEWMDAMAIKDNRKRPEHLFLLRKYGAKSRAELE